ncbi:MAG: 6-phosphofructokinase, partial [Erysipelotrichaceae bacterium]
MEISSLQKARYAYNPKLPAMLRNGIANICVKEGEETQSVADQEKIKALFPNTYGKHEITFEKGENTAPAKKQVVGVILSGGQAPGGHNVVCGLYDALKATNKENVLYGFKKGPSGLLEDDYLIFDDEYIDQFRNTGGFDIIGSGRTKLETKEQFAVAAEVCKKHCITAIVIIGGDDSNT